MITYQQFVLDFPEFANATTFPQSGFNFYLNLANIMLNQDRWGQPAAAPPNSLFDIGCELFIAHNLVLEAYNQQEANLGGLPGLNRGVISAEGAGQVNMSYDTNASIELDAGHWNLTTFGTRFVNMARMLGAAPMVIAPRGCAGPLGGTAWYGPNPIPGFFSS